MDKHLQIIIEILSRKSGGDAAAELQKVRAEAAKAGDDTKAYDAALKGVNETLKDTAKTTDNFTLKQRELHAVSRELGRAFPEISGLIRAALNPVALSVAAIIGAFQIWKYRTDELARSLGEIQLPDVSEDQISRIDRLTKKMTDAIGKFGELEAGWKTQFDATMSAIDRQEKAVQKLASETAKALGLPGAGSATSIAAEQARQAEQAALAQSLRAEGEAKIKAAGTPGSPEDEAALREKYKLEAAAAEKDRQAASERAKEIAELRDMAKYDPRRVVLDNRFRAQYGAGTSYQQAIDIEHANMASAQGVVDQYGNFQRQSADRERRRRLREQGNADVARADEIAASAKAGRANLGAEFAGSLSEQLARAIQIAMREPGVGRMNRDEANLVGMMGALSTGRPTSLAEADSRLAAAGRSQDELLNIINRLFAHVEKLSPSALANLQRRMSDLESRETRGRP